MFLVFFGKVYFLTFVENQNDMKKQIVFGVEMTSFEEMIFSKYLSNNGIAMNTLLPEMRTEVTREWLKNNRNA